LGIFKDVKSKAEFKKLRTGLAYLKSYIISTKIAGNKYTVLDEDFVKTIHAEKYKQFTKQLGFTSVT
jgi:hypothetical protein